MNPLLQNILKIAAIYNILWGVIQILFPQLFFQVLGMEPTNYPMIWQGMGMVIGVYGIGYWFASYDYVRHWIIVLVGLAGKVFGPIGYLWNLWTENGQPEFGYTLLLNDLPWWLPFGWMLWEAWKAGLPITRDRNLLKK